MQQEQGRSLIALPRAGQVWRSVGAAGPDVRVVEVSLDAQPPSITYEVLGEAGVSVAGPVSVRFDSSWHAFFARPAR